MSTFTTKQYAPTTPTETKQIIGIDLTHVKVRFSDNSEEIHDKPLKLSTLLNHPTLNKEDLVGIMVNGKVYSPNDSINVGIANVTPVLLNSFEGSSMYRRSLVNVVATAAYQTYGNEFGITFQHSVNNGYMINKYNHSEFTQEECEKIKQRMNELIKENKEITTVELSHDEALQYFTETKRNYTCSFLRSKNMEKVQCNYLDGFLTLYIRPLIKSTGMLKEFNLIVSTNKKGLLLLFPLQNKPIPTELKDIETEFIVKNYEQSTSIGKSIGIECIGNLNEKLLKGEKELIVLMENKQDMEISKIADDVADKILNHGVKLVSIAGPSASGKTTFSKKLGLQLKIRGITPVVLSTDDYFKHRLESPKDENGNYDFECLEALRLDDLNNHLISLFKGEAVHPFVYNFKTGRYSELTDKTIQLPPNGVVVMEGLHGIDEGLTPLIPREQKYYIFIAPLTQINIDEYNFVGNQVLRFYRRIVRDYMTRNYSASQTLKNWFSVAKGEEKYIFPFVPNADQIWNSSMDYEIAAIYPYVLPLLRTVPVDDKNYNMACGLLDILEMYVPTDDHLIGKTSLIREFIGGSIFEE